MPPGICIVLHRLLSLLTCYEQITICCNVQVYSICDKKLVSISVGKYWAAGVTTTGDVYMWDGKRSKNDPPVATRLHGVKKATAVSAGETHLLAISSLYHPVYPPSKVGSSQKLKLSEEVKELDEDFMFESVEAGSVFSCSQSDDLNEKQTPSLMGLCEKVAAECIVEPRNCIQILEIADALGADDLKKYCEVFFPLKDLQSVLGFICRSSYSPFYYLNLVQDMAIRNIDYILAVAPTCISSTSLEILANLEKVMDLKSSEPWSHRRLPPPTATLPAVINSEEDESGDEFLVTRDKHMKNLLKTEVGQRSDSFLLSNIGENDDHGKHIRALRKKLQQIEMLELKMSSGVSLDGQQIAKLQTKPVLESSLADLGVPVGTPPLRGLSGGSSDGRSCKKVRQRKKSKQRFTQATSSYDETHTTPSPVKGFMDMHSLDVSTKQVKFVSLAYVRT